MSSAFYVRSCVTAVDRNLNMARGQNICIMHCAHVYGYYSILLYIFLSVVVGSNQTPLFVDHDYLEWIATSKTIITLH